MSKQPVRAVVEGVELLVWYSSGRTTENCVIHKNVLTCTHFVRMLLDAFCMHTNMNIIKSENAKKTYN